MFGALYMYISEYIPDIVPSGRFELGNYFFGLSASHSFTNFSHNKVPNVPISIPTGLVACLDARCIYSKAR